jgi:5-methylcytosine-specific restriction endonuclease McrA
MAGSQPARIREMLLKGDTYKTICEEMGVVKSTVAYHARQIGLDRAVNRPLPDVDWLAVQAFRDGGHTVDDVLREFQISGCDWRKARLAELVNPWQTVPGRRRVDEPDWTAIQAYYDVGHTRDECLRKFRIAGSLWLRGIREGLLKNRSKLFERPTIETLHLFTNAQTVKAFIIREKVLPYGCSICGISSWRGLHLELHLDHINGNPRDNRPDNVRLLCPNCHSQTDTYSYKNRRRRGEPAKPRSQTGACPHGVWVLAGRTACKTCVANMLQSMRRDVR